jgi:spore coat polysaccharide biosynthesis protein SpsF
MIGSLIFARMSSTRFPGKAIIKVQGKTILEHIIVRVMRSKYITNCVVATTINPEDDIIEKIGVKLGLDVFRGSELDVLDRCCKAAEKFDLDPVVRVGADDPFKDAHIIDRGIEIYMCSNRRNDLVCNTQYPSFPEGMDVEIISLAALQRAARETTNSLHREHVTSYILDNPNKFCIYNFRNEENLSYIRLTLDTMADLVVIRSIYNALRGNENYITMDEIVKYLLANPHLLEINRYVKRTLRYRHLSHHI